MTDVHAIEGSWRRHLVEDHGEGDWVPHRRAEIGPFHEADHRAKPGRDHAAIREQNERDRRAFDAAYRFEDEVLAAVRRYVADTPTGDRLASAGWELTADDHVYAIRGKGILAYMDADPDGGEGSYLKSPAYAVEAWLRAVLDREARAFPREGADG